MLKPESITQLIELVRDHGRVVPVGGNTKPALTGSVSDDFKRISMEGLNGITEYEPSEYTITALAGTPLAEMNAALAKNGQYLPFDPPLAAQGATIGGSVAAGMSGPGAYRFGPVRDFLIGVKFVDGAGRLIMGGGKVVKNAAGFDLPKFLIGSAGRLGIFAEMTFKVFPRPDATLTFSVAAGFDAGNTLCLLSRGNQELDALEFDPCNGMIWGRMAGNQDALDLRLNKIADRLGVETVKSGKAEEENLWSRTSGFLWANPDAPLVKFPIVPRQISDLESFFSKSGAARWYGMGGNVLYWNGLQGGLKESAAKMGRGMILRSPEEVPSPWVGGGVPRPELEEAVKLALDGKGRFPSFR